MQDFFPSPVNPVLQPQVSFPLGLVQIVLAVHLAIVFSGALQVTVQRK
jgi:hypothetical protein